jgi:hypothetical protein
MYTFALYPNLLQPSGAVNLDMLRDAGIAIKLNEGLEARVLSGDFKVEIYVFLKITNVLRIMSGMAGLAFFSA